MVSTYKCTAVCIFLFIYQVYFLFGDMYIRARFTAAYAYRPICDYSGMYVEPMYICMVITYSKGKDQPGKAANPARGQLAELGKIISSLSPFASENLVSRDGFGSPVPRQPAHLHTQAESGAYLRGPYRIPQRRPLIIGTHYVL